MSVNQFIMPARAITRVAGSSVGGTASQQWFEGVRRCGSCQRWYCAEAASQRAAVSCSAISSAASHSDASAASARSDAPSNVAATLLVDTLRLMKQFEEHGLNRAQAEALTRHLTEIILSQTAFNKGLFVSKGELERVMIQIEARQKQFKQEMQVAHEVHYGTMSKEAERLHGQLDKFKADIKHEVDKLTANQKLDLNLERGRLRDDLQQLRDKLATLRNSLEREVNLVRTDMESSKSDTLKWVVVTVVGLLGAGFAAIRLSIH